MKITIQAREGAGYVPREIDAKQVIIPGYEAFTFGIHRPPGKTKDWNITEASTGLAVTSEYISRRTQAEAVENALTRFEAFSVTPAKFAGHVAKALKALKKKK